MLCRIDGYGRHLAGRRQACCIHVGPPVFHADGGTCTTSSPGKPGLQAWTSRSQRCTLFSHARSSWAGSPIENRLCWPIERAEKHQHLKRQAERQAHNLLFAGSSPSSHGSRRIPPNGRGCLARFCLCNGVFEPSQPFRPLCLCPQNSISRQRRLRFEETQFEFTARVPC